MSSQTRRQFLSRSLARGGLIGCSLAASPFATPVTLAATPGEARFVAIILRGAMDGLDVLRPVGDPDFAALRSGLNKGPQPHDLDGFFALHPELSGLIPLWKAGELSFAHAVSTPYRDKRSHFDGQDILEAGTGQDIEGAAARGGWLNRLVGEMPDATADTAFAVGREDMLLMSGDAPVSSWSPDGRIDLSAQSRLLLSEMYRGDPVFSQAGADAMAIAESLGLSSEDSFGLSRAELREQAQARNGAGASALLAEFAARRLREEARIAAFSISGWDTHSAQPSALRGALGQLQGAILTLKSELGPIWEKTAVVAMTEFGRTAHENGTRGTDHGTGGALIMAGGALRGQQVMSEWPGLAEADLYGRRDLMPTRDVRAYPAWMLHAFFGASRKTLEQVIFPGLEMGEDPRIIA